MTPCEKSGLFVGKRCRIVGDPESTTWPPGTLVRIVRDDDDELPICRPVDGGAERVEHISFLEPAPGLPALDTLDDILNYLNS